MPRKEYGVTYQADQDQQRRVILHEAFRIAEVDFNGHLSFNVGFSEKRLGHAWVQVPPCTFTRWCKTRWTGRQDIFPGFYGIEGPKGIGRMFMSPGNRSNQPSSIETALAGAIAFAQLLRTANGVIDLTIGATFGARP